MPASPPLSYDSDGLYTQALADTGAGSIGLTAEMVDPWLQKANQAHRHILEAHQAGTLGYLDLATPQLPDLLEWARFLREDQAFTHQIVFGIGGSSLGARAILETATPRPPGLVTHFSENIDPVSFAQTLDQVDLEHTLLVVITKSGSTIETMSTFWIAYHKLIDLVGQARADQQVVAITDPKAGSLRALAQTQGFQSFEVPPNVGGRFSVLTPVGLVPLALAGYDIEGLLEGASKAKDALKASGPVLRAAAELVALNQDRGLAQVVMMSYCDRLDSLVDWFRQLWAESLGKRLDRQGRVVHTGITPIKALGVVDQHSQVQLYVEGPLDKSFIFLEVESFESDFTVPRSMPAGLDHLSGKTLSQLLGAELVGTRHALSHAGRPLSRWIFDSLRPQAIGAFILAWEHLTALGGELLDVDAFDQPGVELGKRIAHGLLGKAAHLEEAAGLGEGGGGNVRGSQAVL